MLVYVGQLPRVGQVFTEFYILGPEGKAENYPDVLVVGEEAKVTMGVVNCEQKVTDYKVKILIGGQEVGEVGTITLAHEEKWQQEVGFVPARVGEEQKVEFQLYKGNENEPSHVLNLWVDVVASK